MHLCGYVNTNLHACVDKHAQLVVNHVESDVYKVRVPPRQARFAQSSSAQG